METRNDRVEGIAVEPVYFMKAPSLDEIRALLGVEPVEVDHLAYEFEPRVRMGERVVFTFGVAGGVVTLLVYRDEELVVHIHRSSARELRFDGNRWFFVDFESEGLAGQLQVSLDPRVTVVDTLHHN